MRSIFNPALIKFIQSIDLIKTPYRLTGKKSFVLNKSKIKKISNQKSKIIIPSSQSLQKRKKSSVVNKSKIKKISNQKSKLHLR
jgi:hypothetical protein